MAANVRTWKAPVGFPESAVLGFMPYKRAMAAKTIINNASKALGVSAACVRRWLLALENARWIDHVLVDRCLCYRRIEALPR